MKQAPDTKRLMEAIDLLKTTKGITVYQISKRIGYAPQSFSRIRAGGQNMPIGWIHKICEEFGINEQYIFGAVPPALLPEGGKVKIGNAKHIVDPAPVMKVGMYDAGITGPMKKALGDHVVDPNFFRNIPAFNECTLAYKVTGDSMMPRYRSGDIVVCKRLKDKNQVMNGEPYLIITSELSAVKYLDNHSRDNNKYMLRSENPKFSPSPISKKDILGVYTIKGKVELN